MSLLASAGFRAALVASSACSSDRAGPIGHDGTWESRFACQYGFDVPASGCCGNRNLVTPGDPSDSYRTQKLHGVDLFAGQPMPHGGKLDPRAASRPSRMDPARRATRSRAVPRSHRLAADPRPSA